jgi:hypothetical protein
MERVDGEPGPFFDLDWKLRVPPLTLDEIQADPILRGMERALRHQGTVFRVSEREMVRLLQILKLTGEQRALVRTRWPVLRAPASRPTSDPVELDRRVAQLLRAGKLPRPPLSRTSPSGVHTVCGVDGQSGRTARGTTCIARLRSSDRSKNGPEPVSIQRWHSGGAETPFGTTLLGDCSADRAENRFPRTLPVSC